MPEGDTVWLAGKRLRGALRGRVVTRSDFRTPRLATVDLAGRRIVTIASRGKHLLWRFEGGTTLHTHFRMDGEWRLQRTGSAPRGPRHEIRAVVQTTLWSAVGYRIPVIELLPTEREADVVGHLGPDLLGDDWDPDEAAVRLRARAGAPIGEALLDQSALAGIGNVYKSELCFLRGLDPWMPVEHVPDVRGVVDLAKRVLEANRHTAMHVTTGDSRRGRSQWVYGRAGQPCRRCGTPIGRTTDAGSERVTYWCPRCQPPSETGGGAASAPGRESQQRV